MNPLACLDPDDPYPESDGLPMAENTDQYDWLVRIKDNLEYLLAERPDVFVAGNLLWYPDPDRDAVPPMGPDVFVVFGRPKGRRGSYKQWEEDGIAPQVVFEIRSPGNTRAAMAAKLAFYDRHGVEEYYVYAPAGNRLQIWLRQPVGLKPVAWLGGFTSPRLGVRFAPNARTLEILDPTGQPFPSFVDARRQGARAAARAEFEAARAERLAQRLRALGLDPDADAEPLPPCGGRPFDRP